MAMPERRLPPRPAEELRRDETVTFTFDGR